MFLSIYEIVLFLNLDGRRSDGLNVRAVPVAMPQRGDSANLFNGLSHYAFVFFDICLQYKNLCLHLFRLTNTNTQMNKEVDMLCSDNFANTENLLTHTFSSKHFSV